MNTRIQNIILEELVRSLKTEQKLNFSLFTPEDEKFLGSFAKFGSKNLGIIYSPTVAGIHEFIGRSGVDFNLTPNVLLNCLKNKYVSIVPYGGIGRNEDYTLQLNLDIEDVKNFVSADEESPESSEAGGEFPAEPPPGEVPAGPPEETVIKYGDLLNESAEISKIIVEAKKKSKSKVHSNKSRVLKRLPTGYLIYLEKIFTILSGKLHNALEKEHLVADILDNLAYNFGLTPNQILKSYIYYKSQNKLQNIVKDKY